MNESQRIAAFIDSWREQRHLSGNAFTQQAGVASNFLTQLRRGADVQLNTLARAAEAMDMTLLELLSAAGVGGTAPVMAGGEERPDILALIASDPDLLPEAKQHFANQYRLLVRLNPDSHLPDSERILRAVAHAPDEPIEADQDDAAYDA
ncbi:MAG: hypothetical protein RL134_629 [Actinomycetota bacterium]|jgi:transcriptional regulator with XRE-family HTH domain